MLDFIRAKRITFIIKLTGDCNLNCSYCYHFTKMDKNKDYSYKEKMGDNLIEKTIKKLIEMNTHYVDFIWHGGEPLLMGIDTFEKIVMYQNKYKGNKIVLNSIQSNGTLMDKEWIDFFARNKFHVGISIDGPRDLHVLNRNNNQMSEDLLFNKTLESIYMLKSANVSHGVLTVLTNKSADYVKEIFDFYVEHKIMKIGFLPSIVIGNNGKIDLNLSMSPTAYAQFMKDFFDLWSVSNQINMSIRDFDEIIRGFNNVRNKLCKFNNSCTRHFTIQPDGSIFLCDNYPSIDRYRIGSIHDTEKQLMKNSNLKKFASEIKVIPLQCKKCKYLKFCGGGCKHDRFVMSPQYDKGSYLCNAYKSIFQHIEKSLINLSN